jgi:hypothetical protein
MKKSAICIAILLFIFTASSYCQLSVGYSTDGNTLGITTNPLNKLWGEFRVNTKGYNQADWSYNDRGITQAYCMFRIFNSKFVSLYIGGGVGSNLISENDKWISGNIPLGIKMNPFVSIPNFYFTGEYNPMIILADGAPIIHSVSIGFRYVLSKKE